MLRFMAALTAIALSAAAFSQTTTAPAAKQQVQGLAPQLVEFAGSAGNFDSLVTGLTTGAPVTLVTVLADGTVQIVSFVPGTPVPAADLARLLETARQNLIVRGIATPSAQQLAASLVGGTVVTLSGVSTIPGVLTGSTRPTNVQVRTESAVLPGSARASNLSAVELEAVRNALASGTAVTLGTSTANAVTFAGTGIRMSDFEVNQALQLAAALLAQQGVLHPTAEQLRAALFGGTLLTASGGNVLLQGVLQGRVRNTSDSASFGTSASPAVNTSASRPVGARSSPPAGVQTRTGTAGEAPRAITGATRAK
jgi:hypothetical protein